ncbi:uncharacterized protein F5147DRAFT_764252 [Suillus discolor]|uniref:Uncharacterized protein n=1 Tax=Suillus discolor TaxID=1912936 RepID=A0A9P7EUL9_9AGAM|nr:uncharacterized protein F5147DRAFT_764252 [Suillus discolor]KAG2091650.1 hypothetical protein F5147DRAFT_764252 [Suillus discolor]
MKAFNLAFIFTRDSQTVDPLFIKAIALFNANQHEDAMQRAQEPVVACPNANTLVCRTVEAYLHAQIGIDVLDSSRYDETADHFTTAINISTFLPESAIHSRYGDFAVLFGWEFRPLWQIANKKRCHALLRVGRPGEALKLYRCMMDMNDNATKATCFDWCTDCNTYLRSLCDAAFKQECIMFYTANGVADLIGSGDAALAAGEYDRAIEIWRAGKKHLEHARMDYSKISGSQGIDARALVDILPGMRRARERLQSVSRRVTTLQDIAYSLFGTFGVQLPIMYGEKKQNRTAFAGDGSSVRGHCLPADITSYEAQPHPLPSISANEMQISVFAPRHSGNLKLAVKLRNILYQLSAYDSAVHIVCVEGVALAELPPRYVRMHYGDE